MTEATRQNIMRVFLGGVLAVTVGAVWVFGAQRREEITALGQEVTEPKLGFAIRMPAGWERLPTSPSRYGSILVYMRPTQPNTERDRLTKQLAKRYIFFIITPRQATDERIVYPLAKLVKDLDDSDNYFDGYQRIWSGPPRPGKYQRRSGTIRPRLYLRQWLPYPIELGLFEQITAEKQVFWCILAGNTELSIADEALLDAVAKSFRLLENDM